MNKKTRHLLLLLLTAVIWGFAFTAQSFGGGAMGAYSFNTLRYVIGFLVLQPVILKLSGSLRPDKNTLLGGIFCGICLGVASSLQQVGILLTTPGKAGFLTAFYMVLVAVFGFFLKKKTDKTTWIAVILGVAGLWLICIPKGENLTVNRGDLLCILCAVFFAVHILVIDHFIVKADAVKMAAIQFLTAAAVSGICWIFSGETLTLSMVKEGLLPLLYVGLLSTGAAYTLQIVGQEGVEPAIASLIMSLESVFSLLGEAIFMGLSVTGREFLGCVIMFAAILVTQLPDLLPVIRKGK